MADKPTIPDENNDPATQAQTQADSKASPQQDPDQQPTRRRASNRNNDDDQREATELDEYTPQTTPFSASLSSGEYRITPRDNRSERSSVRNDQRSFSALRRFWSRHVALTVLQKGNRDYFALERTFLAYIRTSVSFSMEGVLIAQLFRLPTSHSTRFDFYTVGIPLSVAFHCCAMLIATMGAFRFWRQQNAMARGKVFAGGWEINCIGMLSLMASITLLALVVAIIIKINTDS